MAIDIDRETLFPLAELPDHLPRGPGGKKIHVSTGIRWVRVGVRGVRLEAAALGRTLFTSREAVRRFSEALAMARGGLRPAHSGPSAAARRADEQLEAAGL